ncbi:MAG: Gfo/Idh/MocA family protein, partial [Gemmatimonadales bacterium]
MTKVNLCMLGCGAIARIHARVARTLKSRANLLFASRTLETAREYNRRFGGLGAFGSYEEACRATDVDAVFICTPHVYHLENVRLAAEHGKHVIVEKPATVTLEELDTMIAVTDGARIKAMVAENYRFKPLLRVLRRHIDADDIGTPAIIEINRSHRSNPTGWRADASMMGGGALLEGGVHWVNLLCELGGEPTHVAAAEPTVAYDRVTPFEDSIEAIAKFAGGAVGKLLHTWRFPTRLAGPLGLSRIFGTAGTITFESNGIFVLVRGKRTRLRIPGIFDIMGYRAMLRH